MFPTIQILRAPSVPDVLFDDENTQVKRVYEFPTITTMISLPSLTSKICKTSQHEYLDPHLLEIPLYLSSRQSSECKPDFHRIEKKSIASVQRWNKLGSVISAISKFQTTKVTTIQDQFSLHESLKDTDSSSKISTKEKSEKAGLRVDSLDSPMKRGITDFREIEKFFKLITRSSPQDLVAIQQKIIDDPKRFLHDIKSPERLINAKFFGQTPCYAACKDGHLNTLKILLENQANARTLSETSEGHQESNLEVAARWNHEKIVELLLNEVEWPYRTLQSALKQTTNKKIKASIKRKLPNRCCF